MKEIESKHYLCWMDEIINNNLNNDRIRAYEECEHCAVKDQFPKRKCKTFFSQIIRLLLIIGLDKKWVMLWIFLIYPSAPPPPQGCELKCCPSRSREEERFTKNDSDSRHENTSQEKNMQKLPQQQQ